MIASFVLTPNQGSRNLPKEENPNYEHLLVGSFKLDVKSVELTNGASQFNCE